MAEIPIERKPRSSMSPLLIILFVVVIIGLAWYWWTNKNATPTTTGSITPAVQVASVLVPATYSSHFRRI
jgi:formate hydrogenlyase subunit 3/multisubunit Na+/H+ antiporter MnhD subunit